MPGPVSTILLELLSSVCEEDVFQRDLLEVDALDFVPLTCQGLDNLREH